MRRLKGRSGERGASAVLVAVLLVPLIGFAAIAVDLGAMYSERAQLQNSADAGALAAARYCGNHNDCATAADQAAARAAALSVTGGNVLSGDPDVAPLSFTSNTVRVIPATLDMEHPLAAVLGIGASDVRAAATAKWDHSRETVVPFAIGACAINKSGTNFTEITNVTCPGYVPGGFGWLESGTTSCVKQIALNEFTDITTGNTGKCEMTQAELVTVAAYIGCDLTKKPMKDETDPTAKFFLCLVGHRVMIPVYDLAANCPGTAGVKQYCITKFATYDLKGLHIKTTSGTKVEYCILTPAKTACNFPNDWGTLGFTGEFVNFVGQTLGNPAVGVRLIG